MELFWDIDGQRIIGSERLAQEGQHDQTQNNNGRENE
jgi:hypothetical protein